MTLFAKAIHILGGSGAVTSTLGKAISEKYGHTHLDTDDYSWVPTDPRIHISENCPSGAASCSVTSTCAANSSSSAHCPAELDQRSRALHMQWLKKTPCRVMLAGGNAPTDETVSLIAQQFVQL